MNSFVLKNNKGLYYTSYLNWNDIHTQDINEANIFNNEVAYGLKSFLDKTTCEKWKVVEITVTEGDLEKQLREKDKEIEKLNLMIKTLPNHDAEIEQLIRKQVCDKIKTYDRITNKQETSYTDYVIGLCEILDQIEKGE